MMGGIDPYHNRERNTIIEWSYTSYQFSVNTLKITKFMNYLNNKYNDEGICLIIKNEKKC